MQNQAAVEALYSATFVEDYLDYVENVPDDIQRIHTRLRELDMRQQQVKHFHCVFGISKNFNTAMEVLGRFQPSNRPKKLV